MEHDSIMLFISKAFIPPPKRSLEHRKQFNRFFIPDPVVSLSLSPPYNGSVLQKISHKFKLIGVSSTLPYFSLFDFIISDFDCSKKILSVWISPRGWVFCSFSFNLLFLFHTGNTLVVTQIYFYLLDKLLMGYFSSGYPMESGE